MLVLKGCWQWPAPRAAAHLHPRFTHFSTLPLCSPMAPPRMSHPMQACMPPLHVHLQDLGFGMGHERYLAPEILFRPSLCPAPGAAAATPLPQVRVCGAAVLA